MCDCNYKFTLHRPSAQVRPMTLPPSLYLDCLSTAEWALRRTRSMSRLYFADIERPLTGAILTNWSRLIAHGRSALRIPCTRAVLPSSRRGVVGGADAYSQACKLDLRRQGLECKRFAFFLAPQPIVFRHVNLMIAKLCQANNFFLTGTALNSTIFRGTE
jgi:hypothetical protein